jgi:hypothetical protein
MLAIAALLAIRHPIYRAFIASAETPPVKPQKNSISSCSGTAPIASPEQPSSPGGPKRHSVTLSWNASPPSSGSPGDAVTGYYVYRSQASQTYADGDRLNSLPLVGTRCSDATVGPGKTYYYVVKAVTEKGAQSVVSKEIKAVIPLP